MTPEQKAKELVDLFKYNTRAFNETNGWEDTCYNAKQCALIAQKNLLEKLQSLNITDEFEENVLLEINVL